MPYLAVGFGLYIFHSAWIAILAYHVGILLVLWIAKFKILSPFRITIPFWKLLIFALMGASAGIAMYFLWPYAFVSPALTQTLEQWGLPAQHGRSSSPTPRLSTRGWRNYTGADGWEARPAPLSQMMRSSRVFISSSSHRSFPLCGWLSLLSFCHRRAGCGVRSHIAVCHCSLPHSSTW